MAASHPSELDLERASSGERVNFLEQPVAHHVEACAQCSAAISALVEERQAFHAARPSPDAFVGMLLRRASHQQGAATANPTIALARLLRPSWEGAAAVCGVVVVVLGIVASPGYSRLRESLGLDAPPRWATKGDGEGVSVIRRRNHEQLLERRRVAIKPGDELRLHFSVHSRRRMAAGILSDDGTWVPFFEREFEAGSHTPAETIRVDTTPNAGTILFGAPEQVALARQGIQTLEVQTTELIWTAP